ncbi:MAG: DUF485 domain-containing protein [Corynebacterium sp.]|uniref:DUF485 domain-containing protein n=1 Tax=Corynebacterium sp. TaxID=1720 RepID=UPI0026DC1E25|nr:DUF485 domain-containing protein [Corynebacterium sp.]MDO5030533.1 DUF485 domain-containing protein [Corynebacterium sp.]
MSATPVPAKRHKPQAAEYRYVQDSAQFQQLRSTFRSFAIPTTIAGLVWYIAFVLFATFAPDVMAIPVLGNINLGIVLGLLQFVTTFAITWIYINFANKKLEPLQAELREAMESGEIAEIISKKGA